MGIPEFDNEIKLFKEIMGKVEESMGKLSKHEKFVSELNSKLCDDYAIYIEKTKNLEELLSTVATNINETVSSVNEDLNLTFTLNSDKQELVLDNTVKLVSEKYVNFKNDIATSTNTLNNLVDLLDKRLLALNESKLEFEGFIRVKQKQIDAVQMITEKKLSDFNLTLLRLEKQSRNSKRIIVIISLLILAISVLGLVI